MPQPATEKFARLGLPKSELLASALHINYKERSAARGCVSKDPGGASQSCIREIPVQAVSA